ncbi:conserved hypothetical protein [Beijerinckia indica subsp. indica ATCC 9039]|uniref:DUF5666 domain-containing protein n=2 Tax=Beijerinckia TaxID=532 RepID=B2IH21_BEII9|nr:conserved hypothetical protein [Beijerinckia indica subsp. indica ATCC 9039]
MTRRDWLKRLAKGAIALVAMRGRGLADPRDQGIGGTGVTPQTPEGTGQGNGSGPLGDRGIGGTGVIGTIRRFGSIYVNDLRIAYPDTVKVRIDGVPASPADLKLGQVVRTVAHSQDGGFATNAIDVTSEVVGPVEKIAKNKTMVVLGQKVSTASLRGSPSWRLGDQVAVSGLRRPDGTIIASLIEHRSAGMTKVAGPVSTGADGGIRIGGLRLAGVDPGLIGRRAVLEGQMAGETYDVRRGAAEATLFETRPSQLSLETYVEHAKGGSLRFGSGWDLAGGQGLTLPQGQGPQRAVISTRLDQNGQAVIESIRPLSRDGAGQERGGFNPHEGRPGENGRDFGGLRRSETMPGGHGGREGGASDPRDWGRAPNGTGRPGGFQRFDTGQTPHENGGFRPGSSMPHEPHGMGGSGEGFGGGFGHGGFDGHGGGQGGFGGPGGPAGGPGGMPGGIPGGMPGGMNDPGGFRR